MSRLRLDALHGTLERLVHQGDACTLAFLLKWHPFDRRVFATLNGNGVSLLHEACLKGDLEVVSALVEQGADVSHRSSVGWTALHAATLSGSLPLVQRLVLSCCSDVLAVDDMGCCAVDLTRDVHLVTFLGEQMDNVCMRKRRESTETYGLTVALAVSKKTPDAYGAEDDRRRSQSDRRQRDSGVFLSDDASSPSVANSAEDDPLSTHAQARKISEDSQASLRHYYYAGKSNNSNSSGGNSKDQVIAQLWHL